MIDNGDGLTADAELARLASVNLNLLVPLMALLEERSVTKAASKVGLSQPAMSHALRRMRLLLDDELIVRQGSAMVLTPRSVELIAPLRRALHQAAKVINPSTFDPAVDRRTITIAMTSSTAFVIGGAIARLVARHAPHAVLRISTANVTSSTVFADEAVDVVLLSEEFESPFPRDRLYENRWVVIAPARAPRYASVAELLGDQPHVAYDASPRRLRPYEVLDEMGVAYRVRARVSDFLLIPQLISVSGGVAIHSYGASHAFAEFLDLRIEEFPFPVPGLGIDMIWNPWLVDDEFRNWLRGILVEAALSRGLGESSAP